MKRMIRFPDVLTLAAHTRPAASSMANEGQRERPPPGRLPHLLQKVVYSLSSFGVWVAVFMAASLLPETAQPAQETLPRPTNLPELIRMTERGVFFIRVQDAEGKTLSSGTGFLTDAKGTVLTSLHIIRPPVSPKVAISAEAIDPTGRVFTVKGVKAEDEALDLVLLQLSDIPENGIPLTFAGDQPPERGDFVLVLGHPNEFRFVSTDGIVSAVNKASEWPPRFYEVVCPNSPPDAIWIQTSAAVSMGNSGGPMLNASGQVMGVMQLKAFCNGMSFALHVSSARRILSKPQGLTSLEAFTRPEATFAELTGKLQSDYFQYEFRMRQPPRMRANTDRKVTQRPDMEHPGKKYFPQLIALAEANRGRSLELKALLFLVMELSDFEYPAALESELSKASQRLIDGYRDDRRILPVLSRKLYPTATESRRYLRSLAEQSSDPDIRALAALSLAEALAFTSTGESSRLDALALARIAASAKAEFSVGQESVSKLGRELVDRLRVSMPGCAAPPLSGVDQDGKKVCLTNELGRHVVIAFWNERIDFFKHLQDSFAELANHYIGAPISFISIRIKGADEAFFSTSFNEAPTYTLITEDKNGPNANAWHVKLSPTIFIIDPKGVISHRITAKPNPASVIANSTFLGFGSHSDLEWNERLTQALETIPSLTEAKRTLTSFLTQGPWLSADGLLGDGPRTIFLRDNGRTSINTFSSWSVAPPHKLLLHMRNSEDVELEVNRESGTAVVRSPERLLNCSLKLRDFSAASTEGSETSKKIRECLLKETWEWFQYGKKDGEVPYMKFRFKPDGTTDSTLLPAWEIRPSGQIWVYVYMGTYWAFELDIEKKIARNNLADSQIKDHKTFSSFTPLRKVPADR